MASFHFKLAPVVDMRQTRDDEAQRALAHAERRVRDAERRLDEAEALLAAAYLAATEAERVGHDISHLFWHRNWIVVKTRDVEARRLEVQERKDVRDVTAREARSARVALRVLERLRDRKRRVFDLEQARQEMLAIDELATLRAARRLGDTL
jgi:flagellar export protein FliJ